MCHNYWTWALDPGSHNYWAHVTTEAHVQEPMLHHKSHHHKEKPRLCNEEQLPVAATGEKSVQQQRPNTAKNKQIRF